NMLGLDFIVCGYEYDVWQNAIAGLENEAEGGRRCTECFRIRLAKTAQFAKKKNFNAFTTTLTISPHKNSKIINAIGNEIALKDGITFLEKDLKKEGGFRKSLEYSKKYGLYRQNYCGCEFSVKKTF
ncbi:MAG: epoxyqueuosine reductase QueH, partial [Candidatus Woesearchaeota archaeon]